jgi:uncharacterized Zn finger protein (UPF0148 family)
LKYCLECKNLLLPKDDKLYCKVCDKFFKTVKIEEDDYKVVRMTNNDEEAEAPVIKKDLADKVSEEDREAYEDFFGNVEDVGE